MQHYDHNKKPGIGVILTNLGTPNAPTTKALRQYLSTFLWDRRVVEIPRVLWWLILHGVVLRTRPKQSAKLYQKIWTQEGSPLKVDTQALVDKCQALYCEDEVKIVMAMRYGAPSIESALASLKQAQVRKIIILPLYPQYSAATTGSTFDAIAQSLCRWRYIPELHFISQYAGNEAYIRAIADSMRHYIKEHGQPEKFVFSFHGIPKLFFEKGDPYSCFCHKTTRLVTERLGLAPEDWCLTFQSRLGRAEWLTPYTDVTLEALPKQGVKKIAVICPGFSIDCLETLEEINIQNRALFMKAGGEYYGYIPALNHSQAHVEMIKTILSESINP